MTSMDHGHPFRRVIGGVDTHKYVHVAAALDEHGARLGTGSFAADRSGYAQLITWATSLGAPVTFGVEGSGSYGAGLTSALRRSAIGVVEVLRTVKVAKDVAVKARSAALISLRQVLVNAPAELREQLEGMTKMALIRRCAALPTRGRHRRHCRRQARFCERSPGAGSPWTRRSAATRNSSRRSRTPSRRISSPPSASAPTSPPSC